MPVGILRTPEGLLTYGASGDVTEWTRAGERVRSYGEHGENLIGVAIHGDRLVTAGGETIKVWNRITAEPLATFTVPRRARCVAITADGKYAVSFHGDSPSYLKFHLWNLSTFKAGKATSISSDVSLIAGAGDRFVTGSWDSTFPSANGWAIAKGKLEVIARFGGFRGRIQAVAITAASDLAVASSDKGDVLVFDVATQREIARVNGHNAAVRNIALAANDTAVVSVDANAILQSTPITGGTSRRIKGLMTLPIRPNALAVSADGRLAALASHGEVQLVDIEREQRVSEWRIEGADGAVFGDNRLAVVSESGEVTIREF